MKQIAVAILAIVLMIYLGFSGMQAQSTSGPFFMFIGVCTAIGFSLDVVLALRNKIRKANIQNNLRKLGR